MAVRPSEYDRVVAIDGETAFSQGLSNRIELRTDVIGRCRTQEANDGRRLAVRGEGPRRGRTAEQPKQVPSPHCPLSDSQRIWRTPRAVLAFHAAWDPTLYGAQLNKPGTKYLWSHYPPGVRNWIARHGGLKSQTIYLSGRELAALFPTCH